MSLLANRDNTLRGAGVGQCGQNLLGYLDNFDSCGRGLVKNRLVSRNHFACGEDFSNQLGSVERFFQALQAFKQKEPGLRPGIFLVELGDPANSIRFGIV